MQRGNAPRVVAREREAGASRREKTSENTANPDNRSGGNPARQHDGRQTARDAMQPTRTATRASPTGVMYSPWLFTDCIEPVCRTPPEPSGSRNRRCAHPAAPTRRSRARQGGGARQPDDPERAAGAGGPARRRAKGGTPTARGSAPSHPTTWANRPMASAARRCPDSRMTAPGSGRRAHAARRIIAAPEGRAVTEKTTNNKESKHEKTAAHQRRRC